MNTCKTCKYRAEQEVCSLTPKYEKVKNWLGQTKEVQDGYKDTRWIEPRCIRYPKHEELPRFHFDKYTCGEWKEVNNEQ